MVKRALQENYDFSDADFSKLLQNFNENFPKLFTEHANTDLLSTLNKKVADSCADDRFDAYLSLVARTGKTLFEWPLVKNFFEFKIRTAVCDMLSTCPYDEKSTPPNTEQIKPDAFTLRLLMAFRAFDAAPFTIQRLAELLIDPYKHYKKANKFLRALDKNLLVVATVTPEGGRPSLNTPKHEMTALDQSQIADASPPAKKPRTTDDDAVNGQNEETHELEGGSGDEKMVVTTSETQKIQTASNTDVTLASVNLHPNESHPTPSSTEYVELAADHQTNPDEEQIINQEIAQLFWNSNNDDTTVESDKITLDASSSSSPPLEKNEVEDRETGKIDDETSDNKMEVGIEGTVGHFTSGAIFSAPSADGTKTEDSVYKTVDIAETVVTSSESSSA